MSTHYCKGTHDGKPCELGENSWAPIPKEVCDHCFFKNQQAFGDVTDAETCDCSHCLISTEAKITSLTFHITLPRMEYVNEASPDHNFDEFDEEKIMAVCTSMAAELLENARDGGYGKKKYHYEVERDDDDGETLSMLVNVIFE